MSKPRINRAYIERKFSILCYYMGWSKGHKKEDGSPNVGGVVLDYYRIGGGYRIHTMSKDGGEGDLAFRGRMKAADFVLWMDACLWCRGYTAGQFNLPGPPPGNHSHISGDYYQGWSVADLKRVKEV